MRRLFFIALFSFAASALAATGRCDWLFIQVSQLSAAEFREQAAKSQRDFPGESPAWFVGEREPKLLVEATKVAEVANAIQCCGLSVAEIETVLRSELGKHERAELDARKVLRELLVRGLQSARVGDPTQCYDCLATALTFLDPKFYAKVDEGEVPKYLDEVFDKRLTKLPQTEKLRWGDFVVWQRGEEPVHVGVYLGGGLVLQKQGHAGAISVEPLATVTDRYNGFLNRYTSTRVPIALTVTRWRRR